MSRRPSVSVIVPFRGDVAAARRLRDALTPLELHAGDELIVADNSDGGVAESVLASDGPARRARVVSATGERSSYHARNAGARAAGGEWLLFVDADCTPAPDLVDAYFATAPADRAGVIAGQVRSDPTQRAFAARYARSRRFLDQRHGLHDAATGAAVAANLLVRRAAFDRAGGFAEGIRSGGDFDLGRRLLADGWAIETRPAAVVRHRHRESPIDLLRVVARYGSGARWLNRRYPGSSPRWPLRQGLAGSARDVIVNLAHGRVEEASFRAVDGIGVIAHTVGYLQSNDPPE